MSTCGKWVLRLNCPSGEPRLRLVCIPYAGGGPDLFRSWAGRVGEHVELIAVRLPGHGSRTAEKPYRCWPPLVDDTFRELEPYLREPHALYGHSFGGRLAYELAKRAAHEHRGRTRRLFVSGCRSPNAPQARPYMHRLPDAGFREALREMGGTPPEVLGNGMLMRMMLPVIRGEIRLAELWGEETGNPLPVPITALYGRHDRIDDLASTRDWTEFTRARCEVIEMPGGHFFLQSHRKSLLDVIAARLEPSDGRPDL